MGEVESRHRIIEELSECSVDGRDQRYVEHSENELLTQRINGIVLGYEDLNDHDRLRLDPVQAMLAGKDDLTGERRAKGADRGKALAGRSTLNRLELGTCGGDERYCKIEAQALQIEGLLIGEGVKAMPRKSQEIVLDLMPPMIRCTGIRKGPIFMVTIKTTAICRFTVFAGTSLCGSG